MTRVLHVTNGDEAARRLRDAGMGGIVVPWRDPLHDGPVRPGLTLEEQSRSRARWLAETFDRPFVETLEAFRERDRTLARHREFDGVLLWFEHDLYDQLQLLQVLDWFSRRTGDAPEWICIDRHPEVADFRGLGQLGPQALAELHATRRPVRRSDLDAAARLWSAFAGPDPAAIERGSSTRDDAGVLRFVDAALRRHLQQFPSTRDGLSLSERRALEALADGPLETAEWFRRSQIDAEPAPFVGDTCFLLYVRWLRSGRPLIRDADADAGTTSLWHRRVELTAEGRQVLAGRADRTRFQAVDRWLGGVRLEGERPAFRCVSGSSRIRAEAGA